MAADSVSLFAAAFGIAVSLAATLVSNHATPPPSSRNLSDARNV